MPTKSRSKPRSAADNLSEAIRQLETLEHIVPDGKYWSRVRRRAAALAMSLAVFLPDVEDVDPGNRNNK